MNRDEDMLNEDLDEILKQYNNPPVFEFYTKMQRWEIDLIKQVTSKGRFGDVTIFIKSGDFYAVIQKHRYAGTQIYRAPSGGIEKGENPIQAAEREAFEETGLHVKIKKLVLVVKAKFEGPNGEIIPWTSLVFLAEANGGHPHPIDTKEVFTAKFITEEELRYKVPKNMQSYNWGGFRYRAFLTEKFFEVLEKQEEDT